MSKTERKKMAAGYPAASYREETPSKWALQRILRRKEKLG